MASQPTRGLDVGSIEFVHKRIIEERDKGVAVVIISAELDEIYALADRIAVMYRGPDHRLPAAHSSGRELGLLMAGAPGDGAWAEPETGAGPETGEQSERPARGFA